MKDCPNSLQRGFLSTRTLTLFVLCGGIACLLGMGTRLVFSGTQAPGGSTGALTFDERVAYQYAIEEVYWHHRIWPKDNPVPKPSLDAIVSKREIEKKVEDYLRKSQLVTDERGSPITATELQAEMDRIASHTKQPDVLRELFAALGNDAFVIAECLARPILAERLVNDHMIGRDPATAGGRPLSSVHDTARLAVAPYQTAYKLPEISPLDCVNDSWTPTTIVNAPDARRGHTAVWTGSEMIIWGGLDQNFVETNTGGRYNPALDSWITTSTTNAPSIRWRHTAVWTGIEMIVWAGSDSNMFLNSGGRYDPVSDTWTATSSGNAPTARVDHTAVWTGGEMIVWGGYGCSGNCNFNSGGRYNPGTDNWTPTSTVNVPSARFGHTAVWTGSDMTVWGGTDAIVNHTYLHTGGRYSPANDSWTPTSLMNVPLGRIAHTAVWTGSEMIVWGGVDETFNDTNTGGRYNPVNDSWTATSPNSAPSPRDSHTGVWTASEMIVWGGGDQTGDFNNGGRYNAGTDSWTATATADAPEVRESHTAVWTGSQMIVWGGIDFPQGIDLNTGGRYCARSPPMAQNAFSRKTHGAAGTFDVPLPLTGNVGIECRTGGATNDYQTIINFATTVTVGSASVTSGTGSVSSFSVSGSQVTVNLTGVTNAQIITVTLINVNDGTSSGDVPVSMGVLIGDVNGNGTVNATDVALTKSQVGMPVGSSNFREDVNANGLINSVDVAQVKSKVGTALPP